MSLQSLHKNFSVICRTCLTETAELQSLFIMENIFEETNTSLGNLLMSFASVEIIKGDGLPENICLTCVEKLDNAVSFRKLCEKSNDTLRLWISTSQKETENIQENEFRVCDNYEKKKNEKEELCDLPATDLNSTNNKCDKDAHIGFFNKELVDTFDTDGFKGYNSTNSEHEIEENKFHNYTECNDNFKTPEEYNKDQGSINLNTYTCEICGKRFKGETSLRRHFVAHEQEKNGEVLEKNKTMMSKKRKLPRTCTICNKTFRFHSNLERHVLTHTGEKPFLCNVCGKNFTQLSYLKIHSFIHTGEKPYKCQMCERSFGAPGTLMTHIRTHTGERPHICKICGKDFSQSGYLSAHIRIHTGEKPVECKVCHRRFNQRGRLTVHMRMHSGEKPYTCKECGRSFAVKGTLKKHMRTHTGERPYVCNVCGQAFTQSGTLATHMKIHRSKLVV